MKHFLDYNDCSIAYGMGITARSGCQFMTGSLYKLEEFRVGLNRDLTCIQQIQTHIANGEHEQKETHFLGCLSNETAHHCENLIKTACYDFGRNFCACLDELKEDGVPRIARNAAEDILYRELHKILGLANTALRDTLSCEHPNARKILIRFPNSIIEFYQRLTEVVDEVLARVTPTQRGVMQKCV